MGKVSERSSGRQHSSLRRLGVLLLLLSGASCRSGPEPQRVESLLQIALPPPALGHREACAAGPEIRPAFGCPELIPLQARGEPLVEPGRVTQRYLAPAWARGARAVVKRMVRREGEDGFQHLPTEIVPALAHEIEIAFPVDEAAGSGPFEVAAVAYQLPPLARQAMTSPVRIGERAVLAGAIGVDPIAVEVGGGLVRFQLFAHPAEGEKRMLLQETLDPKQEKARGWLEHRLDLSAFAGREVTFELRTTFAGRETEALVLPLWSPGQVLVPDATSRRPNVLLVSLDTLRADHVGAYGQSLPTTPHLDRFATEGVLFENAVAPYPSTTASHMSMLTGLYPSVHGVLAPMRGRSTGIATLAELLARHGYQTAAITEDGMIEAKTFSRGFGSYLEFKGWHPLASDGHVQEGVDAALAWLDRHPGERFFLFLHTYQVHSPYTPPPGFDLFSKDLPADTTVMERQRRAYAGELRFTDLQMGRLLDGLDERGLDGSTVVVITADHGEAFGELGAVGHGFYLIEPVLHVPLLLRASGLPQGARVRAPVSLVDLTPTILELAGVPAPDGLQGLSLLPLIADPGAEPYQARVVYSERGRSGQESVVARRGASKWVVEPDGRVRAFDLARDPGETVDLEDAALLEEGRGLVESFRAKSAELRAEAGASPPPSIPLDPETREKLRRLGYVD